MAGVFGGAEARGEIYRSASHWGGVEAGGWLTPTRPCLAHPAPLPLQEGHTAFATKEEANKEVLDILDLYR